MTLTTDPRPTTGPRTPYAAARVTNAVKAYGSDDAAVVALRGVSLAFDAGQLTAIMGPSGSGKSTLVHCLAGLDTLTDGQAFIGDTDLAALTDRERTLIRRDRLGFIAQSYNLLPTLTAEENIALPARLARAGLDRGWLDSVIATLRIGDRLAHRPSQLSGGQQQRVAVARALARRPEVVFGDEPTGALDSRSSAELLAFLRRAVDTLGQTVIMVTHDPVAASYADRVVFLADGQVVTELLTPSRDSVLDAMKGLGE